MLNKRSFIQGSAIALMCLAGFCTVHAQTSRQLLGNMLTAADKVKTLRYTMKSWERIEGETIYNDVDVKMQRKPRMVYLYTNYGPNEGVEVLYIEGKYDGHAYVNPNRWYLTNLKFDPYGSRMREKKHHTIFETGFDFMAGIIRAGLARVDSLYGGNYDKYFVYDGKVDWKGKPCHKLTITDPDFGYQAITVKEGESLMQIANRYHIAAYMIIEKNDNIDDFDDLRAGMTIKIPTSYAKKTVLYLDAKTYLPIVQIMYDEVGQFERYEYDNLQYNVPIDPAEFTPDYKGYGF